LEAIGLREYEDRTAALLLAVTRASCLTSRLKVTVQTPPLIPAVAAGSELRSELTRIDPDLLFNEEITRT